MVDERGTLVLEDRPSENRPVDTTWVEQHSQIAVQWKKAIARYSGIHYVRYGDVVQIGSGTQMRMFIEAIQDRQRDQDRRLDLLVLTSNLEVVAKGRQPGKYPMRIILTGGEMLESLYCLAGEYAAKAVSTELFFPRVVVFGAAGIKFTDLRPLSYHFPDEVSTQVAYATRPTQHRIIMCDHTKFGFHDGLKADLTLEALLDNTETCTVVTSMPDDDDASVARLEREQEALRQSLHRIAADDRYAGKDFVLEFVSRDAERVRGISLKDERANLARRAVAPGGS
jgi:DeoR/GlpR family transcriptional regulator of sugar metabolism